MGLNVEFRESLQYKLMRVAVETTSKEFDLQMKNHVQELMEFVQRETMMFITKEVGEYFIITKIGSKGAII